MKLNNLFTDGAVFQRRMPIPVFGKTDPNSKVEITFDGMNFYGMAGEDGSFLVRMSAKEAGGPYILTVRNTRTNDFQEVKNILIGEVWLASGQSNMEFTMNSSPIQKKQFECEMVNCDSVRMFTVPKRASQAPENQIGGIPIPEKMPDDIPFDAWSVEEKPKWLSAYPQNIAKMSAVALWFAKKLNDKLNIPIGIISSSWGGTIVEAWTSMEMLRSNPALSEEVSLYQEELSRPERWKNINDANPLFNYGCLAEQFLIEKYCIPNPPDSGFSNGWANLAFDDSDWQTFNVPNSWIEKKICGNGVVWIRKKVTVPESWKGKDIELHLGGIDKQDSAYFNGEKIGSTGKNFEINFWNIPRCYDIPGNIVKAGENIVSVRAYSFIYDGSFGGESQDYYLQLKGTNEIIPCGREWLIKPEVDFHFAGFPRGSAQMGPHTANSYAILFDSMIRPLIPYGIKGAIWYQGESNTRSEKDAVSYYRMLSDMIHDWRFRWAEGDFPFIQVGLAGYTEYADYSSDCKWAILRDSQRKVTRNCPNCGIASAVDLGDVKDIHPKDKYTVACRLALWALEHTYAVPGIYGTSPEVSEQKREGNRIRLYFENCANGLYAKNKKLHGFYVASADGEFVQADASVDGNTVVLTCSNNEKYITKVRYAWSQNPMKVLSLYNSADLPASPFEISIS